MTSIKKAIRYGVIVWLIPFVVAFAIFPIRESNRALFESIMPVVVVAAAVALAIRYLRHSKNSQQESVRLGVLWLAISIAIDLAIFLPPSPMQMSFMTYVQDIGLTYLIIPICTIGIGRAFEHHTA